MKTKLLTACLGAAALAICTGAASAQGGSTDRNGNANGSQHIGSGPASAGAMHGGATGTTGMNRSAPSQNSPNGSPGAPPTSKQGPGGDPSRNNDAPK